MDQPITILGAGLTGLSAAFHLQRLQAEYLILEKESRVGGLCRSETIDGFTFDYSIHILYSSNSYVADLIKSVLIEGNLTPQPRQSWIYSKGVYTEYPFQAHTFGLPRHVVKECVLGLIYAKYERRPMQKPRNFAEWIHQTFGAGIAKHFMVPYNAKLWSIDPALMNYDWIADRVPVPDLQEVIDGALGPPRKKYGPNAEFWYPKRGGIESLARGFLSHIRNLELNAKVTKIFLKRQEIQVNNRASLKYTNLISTLPLPHIIQLIDTVPSEIRYAAASLQSNTVYTVNLGIDRENISSSHWIYFPEPEYVFHRVSFPMNFASSMAPPGKSSITAEISRSRHEEESLDALIDDVKSGLAKAGILNPDDCVLLSNVLTIQPAYVIYDLEHHKNVKLILDFLESNNILSCGRFGEWEYLNMDHSILSGKRAAEKLLKLIPVSNSALRCRDTACRVSTGSPAGQKHYEPKVFSKTCLRGTDVNRT